MLLSRELFSPEPAAAPSFTMEDHIGLERSTLSVAEARQEIHMASLQLESLHEAEERFEAFLGLYNASMEDDALGIDLEKAYRLTLENYFGPEFAEQAEFSQEGIADVIKRIGRATANAGGRIQRGWKDFIASWGDGWGKLKNRAETVTDSLKNVDRDAKMKESEVKMAGGSRLHMKGSMEPKDLVDGYPDAMTTLTKFAKSSTDFGQALIDRIGTAQKAIAKLNKKSDKEEIEKLQKESKADVEKLIDAYHKEVKGMNGAALPGGQALMAPRLPQFAIDRAAKDEKLTQISSFNANKFGKYREKDKVEAPSTDQMRTLIAAVEGNIQGMTTLIEEASELIMEASEMSKSKENLPKIKRKISFEEIISGQKALADVLIVMLDNYFGNNVARWMDYIVGNLFDIYSYLFSTTRAMVEYCERGAKNYE